MTTNTSKLREYLDILRGLKGEEIQFGAFKCLKILKVARDSDLSGNNLDFTRLDLRYTPLNGVRFSGYGNTAVFDKSHISENTFLP